MNKKNKIAIVLNSVMFARINEQGLLTDKCPESLCGFNLELAEYAKVAAEVLIINECDYTPENTIDKNYVQTSAEKMAQIQIESLRENGELIDEDSWASVVTKIVA